MNINISYLNLNYLLLGRLVEINIETERLILREFVKGDFLSIHNYASDPEVVKCQP